MAKWVWLLLGVLAYVLAAATVGAVIAWAVALAVIHAGPA
jgi:hypothetical protein